MTSIGLKFRKIIAAYYWAAYSLHHKFFLKPGKPLKNAKLVVVGSFRTGGAGKTPFTLWLANDLLAQGKTVAILCHKYAFDEVRMYKHALAKFIEQGSAQVIATDNRYKSAHQLDRRSKSVPNSILCDDGFEDSRLRPDVIFRLDWEKAPTEIDQLIPAGIFRSLRQDHLKDEPRTCALKCFGTAPDVLFRIKSITNAAGDYPGYRQSIAVCGLGDPKRFIRDLEREEYPVKKTILCPDHDKSFQQKVEKALQDYPDTNIIITEKDSCRLSKPLLENPQIFVARQSVTVQCKIVF